MSARANAAINEAQRTSHMIGQRKAIQTHLNYAIKNNSKEKGFRTYVTYDPPPESNPEPDAFTRQMSPGAWLSCRQQDHA